MKILYIGTYAKHCSDKYRLKGFKEAGNEVVTFDYRLVNNNEGTEALKTYIIHYLYSFNPDIVFVNKGEVIRQEIIEECKNFFPSVWVLFYGDVRDDIAPHLRRVARCYDAILVNSNDRKYNKKFRDIGAKKVMYHHTATDLDEFYKMDVPEVYDIGFFGGNYKNIFPDSGLRRDIVNKLNKSFKMLVLGHNWEMGQRPVFGEELVRAMSSCKIILGINAFNDINLYTSNRTWNSMACGTYFTYYFKGIDQMFSNGNELVWFNEYDGLEYWIRSYLDNPNNRRRVYENGRLLIGQKQTYKHRSHELEKIYKELKNDTIVQATNVSA